ncbi:hypothetical protein FGG08_005110 [Glutinoglossum americanum]|uniref:Nucleoside transporter family n=1 Tax=Glutinoglossum americanum TaxID=1670608 RepID=A0A9P8KWC8_9PEZI|nr:hypothetical protein FGG08_005110 [Glutinoglossum americanum]
MIESIQSFFQRQRPSIPASEYEPLEGGTIGPDGERVEMKHDSGFSWLEYSIFLLLGASMLWAWNMFIAAANYFKSRFAADPWILAHYQSAILSVSTVGNLGSVLILARLQANASYPKRIVVSLLINIIVFTLLALSTSSELSPGLYLGYVLTMVFLTSVGTGLCQNGVFAYVAGFREDDYTQGIMTGQAIAGVLPCVAQILSVLSVPERDESEVVLHAQGSSRSAFWYFLTATGVSTFTLAAFVVLMRRCHARGEAAKRLLGDEQQESKVVVPVWTLLGKLRWLASAVFICFGVTMVFPVFTQAILSVHPPSTSPRLFHPSIFTPLSILIWNAGDLLGRLATLFPRPSPHPIVLFALSLARLSFIPLYLLCNIGGRGAAVNSDLFYLAVVQMGFGFTNGWVGSRSMVTANKWVEEEEREAAGAFMATVLVVGLSAGSLLSFCIVL